NLVHYLIEGGEVEIYYVVDGNVQQILDHMEGELGATERVGKVDLARVGDAVIGVMHIQVARNRQLGSETLVGVQMDDDDRVAVRRPIVDRRLRTAIGAEQQDRRRRTTTCRREV